MSKTHTFKVHDESVNTYGFRMLTSGADLTEYEKNPVVLYNHNDWEAPIGRAERVYAKDDAIYADILFDTADPRAAEIAGKVERGFLRAASVGAWPPEETTEDEFSKLPGQTGPTVTRWTLREVSICPIGANHNALAMYDRASGERIDLADHPLTTINHQTHTNMSVITQLLKLSDQASEQVVAEEVRKLVALRDRLQKQADTLQSDNNTLRQRVEEYEKKEREANHSRAVALVDEAVKDGRLDASGRDAWLKDFDRDFDNTSVRLSSIARRQEIVSQLESTGGQKGAVELRDMSMADILKADRLKELKADPELYKMKFREAYGHDPN